MDHIATSTIPDATSAELAALEAALDGLTVETIGEQPIETIEDSGIVMETVETSDGVVMDTDEVRDVEAALARLESYEEEGAGSSIETEPSTEPTETAAKVAKVKTPRVAGAPRAPRDLSALSPEAFVLTTDIPADLEKNKADVIAAAPLQKKIAEKFENILTSVAAGKRPSVYTMDCFEVLLDRSTVTSTELVSALLKRPVRDGSRTYSQGTAASQVGQIMNLFSTLKIAERKGNTLTINPDSTLVAAMAEMLTAPAA